MYRITAWIRALFFRRRLEREMNEEMEAHLTRATERLVARGLSPERARWQALREFGNLSYLQESARRARGAAWLDALTPDLKLALRMLVKHPALSIVGGLGMAVASAFAIGFFTFLAFYFSHPPVDEGKRIVTVEHGDPLATALEGDWRATLFDLQLWREELGSVEDLSAYRSARVLLDVPGGFSGSVELAETTASTFVLARVAPLLGRPLLESDELAGAAPVVVLGYDEWQDAFAGDPAIVGKEVRLAGRLHTIVGVMPEGFRLPWNHGYWRPLEGTRELQLPGEGPRVNVFGRLAPGVERSGAVAEVTTITEGLAAAYPDIYGNRRASVFPYIRHLMDVQQYSPGWIWLIQLAGLLVLGVVAVNVAVLVYARTAIRKGEIAVRTALGASRQRIVSQLFLEALVLGAAATAGGLLIAQIGWGQATALEELRDFLPYWLYGTLPPVTILYAAALAVVSAFVTGALPALQATASRLQGTLKQMGGGTGVEMGRTWTLLIVAQVAVAVAGLPILVGQILSANNVGETVTTTFPAEETLTFRLLEPFDPTASPGSQGSSEPAAAGEHPQAELLRRVAEIPGVAAVTFASSLPRTPERSLRVSLDGAGDREVPPAMGSIRVATNYFEVLGARLLAGRWFNPGDASGDARALIVNRSFVEVFLGGGNALGRTVRAVAAGQTAPSGAEESYEIIGVVEDLYEGGGAPRPLAYHPMELSASPLRLAARLSGVTPEEATRTIREIAAEVAPGLTFSAAPLNTFYDNSGNQGEVRFLLAMMALITLAVILLSAGGISALMSFAVTKRRREIGIRTALGASRGQMITSIFARSARQLGAGIGVGLLGTAILDRATGGSLFDGRAPQLLAGIAALMIVAGLLATLGPARRALRVQPMEALREE